MVPKRPFDGDAESGNEDASANDPKRLKHALRDVLGMFSFQDMAERMEPYIRKMVRESVEQAVHRFYPSFRNSFNQNDTFGGGGFILRFANKPPSTIFTGGTMEAEDGDPIRIELVDANNNTLVTSGPLSSMKIQILVLDGDFGSDDQENWSESQFNVNVIREREGKKPLVTGGDLNVTLKAGVALISDVAFTDNSSWQRSRKFRLGARPVSRTSDGARIREARSEAFVVKDHRGELYKKHHPPQLDDEVWRLERIAKGGASHGKLTERGILTVGNFLQFYTINHSELRNVLGTGISNKIWSIILSHANECVLDDNKMYAYFEAGKSIGLLLDCVYKLIGATFDGGQTYESMDKLTAPQKVMVENLKQQAYQDVNQFIPIDARPIFGPSRTLACPQTDSFPAQNLGLQQLEFPVARHEQAEIMLDFGESANNQLGVSLPQGSNQMPFLTSALRNSFKLGDVFLPCTGENTWSSSVSQWPLTTTAAADVSLQAQTSNWPAAASTLAGWGESNALIFSSGSEEELGFIHPRFGVHMSRIEKHKAAWCKLRAAIRWGSVRRDIAARKLWQSLCHVDY